MWGGGSVFSDACLVNAPCFFDGLTDCHPPLSPNSIDHTEQVNADGTCEAFDVLTRKKFSALQPQWLRKRYAAGSVGAVRLMVVGHPH